MYLSKLFQMQRELSQVGLFNYRGEDRFDKLTLALLVEIGECANNWRGFKFWSVNQLPYTSAVRVPTMMEEDKEYYNPLLEEYVDKLHFILDLGIEIEFDPEMWAFDALTFENVTVQFIRLTQKITEFWERPKESDYVDIIEIFIGLGEMLGFTWEQIEQAYHVKHEINLQRQAKGY